VLLGAVAVALLRWRLWGGQVPAPAPVRLSDWFDPAAVARNRGFRRGLWIMASVGAVLTPLAAIVIACLGRWWRPVVVRLAGARPWRAGLLVGWALAAAATLVSLPLSAARFAWGRGHGVITQPTGAWLLDVLRALGVQLVIMGLLGSLVAVLVWRLPRAWWAALGVAVAAFAFAMSTLTPVLIDPLFQRTEPLRDTALRAQVLDLAHRAGVRADDVRVNDASARTTAANAYVRASATAGASCCTTPWCATSPTMRSAWWWPMNSPMCNAGTSSRAPRGWPPSPCRCACCCSRWWAGAPGSPGGAGPRRMRPGGAARGAVLVAGARWLVPSLCRWRTP